MITGLFINALDRYPTQEELEHYTEIYSTLPVVVSDNDVEKGLMKERILKEVREEIAKIDD